MAIVRFTGGKRCEECDEQIDPRRLRLNLHVKTCTSCEQDWELQQVKALSNVHAGAVVIIRR